MRLDRPIGIWLLLLPGWWSILLMSGGIMKMTLWGWWCFILFGIGAVIMRGAGCVINDLWDRELDKQVERTKSRPIASGEISPFKALVFLATLLLIGLLILYAFDRATFILGIVTLPLIATYPIMKRITWWPQAFLGLTFNFGALMGGSAITGTLDPPAILLYLGGIFWTIGYDTIYAHQDIEDDATAGIKSTARLFQDNSVKWVGRFYGISLICFLLALSLGGIHAALILLPTAHIAWQLIEWKPDDPASSLKIFKSNRDFGLLVLAICAFTQF